MSDAIDIEGREQREFAARASHPLSDVTYHALVECERWMMERATLDADGRRIAEQARRVIEARGDGKEGSHDGSQG